VEPPPAVATVRTGSTDTKKHSMLLLRACLAWFVLIHVGIAHGVPRSLPVPVVGNGLRYGKSWIKISACG
jgi:hypothetical protein